MASAAEGRGADEEPQRDGRGERLPDRRLDGPVVLGRAGRHPDCDRPLLSPARPPGHGGFLQTVDAGLPGTALAGAFAGIQEGTFVRLRNCRLRIPPYVEYGQAAQPGRRPSPEEGGSCVDKASLALFDQPVATANAFGGDGEGGLAADVTVLAPGAMILPIAIYK